ncbi:ParA family protein [Sandarakinorhabdus oryzae]|uniref:ParA family protein n=1 Tax=Sandarakinorhabdus oryzae TaxID=2675220 RepID=UPI0012E2BB88|nr:ParA family protein [Sandarakinorhabdus oryzae]
MRCIALFSVKGGVGKTALAVNLAHAAATLSGRRTLLWDLDAQGAASWLLKVEARAGAKARKGLTEAELTDLVQPTAFPNLDVLAADRSLRRLEADLAGEGEKMLKRALKSLEKRYDRIILDCPPGLTELADQLFRAADLIVVPLIPSPLSTRALAQLQDHLAAEMKSPPAVLPVFSMADRRKALHRAALEAKPDWPVIPYAAAVEAMTATRTPLLAGRKSPAATAITSLWADVERRLAG